MINLYKYRIFILGLMIRIALMPWFGASVAKELFIPFLDWGALHPLENPWKIWDAHYFPYGGLLYLIMMIPRFLALQIGGIEVLGTGMSGLTLLKLPLLAFDIGLLQLLKRLSPQSSKKIELFYWLNPVLIYISYIHGQLDIFSVTFLVLSIYFMMRNLLMPAAFVFAAAALCKTQVLAAAPFLLAYIWNRNFLHDAFKKIVQWVFIASTFFAMGSLPVILANKLSYIGAGSPEALRIFGAQLSFGTGQFVYLGLAIVLGITGRLCFSGRISELGLFFGCGAIMSALVIVTDPAPGWYFWSFPFFSLYYAMYFNAPRSLFLLSIVAYLVNFEGASFLPSTIEPAYRAISFTILQCSMVAMLVSLWIIVIRDENPLLGRVKPILIGIAGDSGAGKDFLTETLSDLFSVSNTVIVNGDDYHKWERGNHKWSDYTHLNPRANHLEKMAKHTVDLGRGKKIFQPHYDHGSGRFTEPREINPGKAVILQGLHTFYYRGMRDNLDIKIFLAPSEDVRLFWKLRRDVSQRGHTPQKVIDTLAQRSGDSKAHIEPQKEFADWVISFENAGTETRADIISGREPSLKVKHIFWNDTPVGKLVEALIEIPNFMVEVDVVKDNIDRIQLELAGNISKENIEKIALSLFPNLKHVTRMRKKPNWRANFEGLNQLIALTLLNEKF